MDLRALFPKEYDNILPDILQLLINQGIDINKQDGFGKTLLIRSVESKSEFLVELFINKKADVNKQNSYGNTALMRAISLKLYKIVDMLIDAKADLNKKNIYNETAIVLAVYTQSEKIINRLIDAYDDINTYSDTYWPILTLISHYYEDISKIGIIKKLIRKKVNLNEQMINGKWTALMLASVHSKKTYNQEVVKLLIDSRADINIQNHEGFNSFMLALNNYDDRSTKETIIMLYEAGSEIYLQFATKKMYNNLLQIIDIKSLVEQRYHWLLYIKHCYFKIIISHQAKFLEYFSIKIKKEIEESTDAEQWILVVTKYNHILKDLFHNHKIFVDHFSLLYL